MNSKTLLIDPGEYNAYLAEISSKASALRAEVGILTFGIYAGITANGTDWSPKYGSSVATTLRTMAGASVRVVVGISRLRLCHPGCSDCKAEWWKQWDRVVHTVKKYSEITWRLRSNLHSKLIMAWTGETLIGGVIGSRNFTGSNWAEISSIIQPEDFPILRAEFEKEWEKSMPVPRAIALMEPKRPRSIIQRAEGAIAIEFEEEGDI